MPAPLFHPVIEAWFSSRFQQPTEAQEQGWPAIAQGKHTLISAPTGSGKTLAAFLTCIDGLVRSGLESDLPDVTRVVYVSPLKALSNDIQKNLAKPLAEIRDLAREMGVPIPEIRTGVRTGDTAASERQRMVRRPPHILITTPESLYILLTSRSGREGLRGVKTLILDEIHAVADDKRGSHLSLSVERLCALAEGRVTRIGLSATQRPIDEMARFLVGCNNIGPDGVPDCLVVDTGHARKMDLSVELPSGELGPIATHELWAETLDSIAALVRQHSTTLLFVNTRRLVERVAHLLSERLGEDSVAAHHGSLSRATRLGVEEKLKSGNVKVCVATSSLELGIDVGVVDLVCQIGSPRSIGLLLQRIGRSGHFLGGTPKGRLYPLTRDELLECAALAGAVRKGSLDTLSIPPWPLDVLAQQIVASCAAEDWDEDDLFAMCRRAYSYRYLPREQFDKVVEAVSRGFAPRLGRSGALLHRDGINRVLRARRGSRLTALTSGGAIPDNADYDVIADPEGIFVGTVNEDFAIESMRGDVFLLGNTSWRILRVESGRVRVQDAQGQTPSVPFWLGEAPGRTWELSQEITDLREGIDRLLERPKEAERWVIESAGVSAEAARQLVDYMAEGKRVLGMVPTGRRIVAERFFDESGGMQLVIHSPLGSRINRAWGMALRKRICLTFDRELQASATDDGINLSFGPQESFALADVFAYLSSRTVEDVLRQAVLQAPVFGTSWRWNATRSLAVLRHAGGRKVPPPLQRMRSDDLLAAVFPAQVACQDNAPGGDIPVPDHPLIFETLRDCLTEAADLEGLQWVLGAIERGDIEVRARDTVQPSVFAHQILNAMPYAFLDDAPLEERRARAVSLRRALPEDARDLGRLDPMAIEAESMNAWPRARDADELHDALLILGVLTEEDLAGWPWDLSQEQLEAALGSLEAGGRAIRLRLRDGITGWISAERALLAQAVYPGSIVGQPPPDPGSEDRELTREEAVLELVRGRVECLGPFTAGEMTKALGLREREVSACLLRIEAEGMVLRGSFRPGADGEEFCDRRILARIHRATIDTLRREVEPVPAATFLRFLTRWHHVEPATHLYGEGGLLDAVELLQGFEAPAGAWEAEILAARVVDYDSALLDRLCLGGEVVWGRVPSVTGNGDVPRGKATLTRATPITLAVRESLDWLLGEPLENGVGTEGAAAEVLGYLKDRGASFLPEIVSATRRLPSEVEDALWAMAAAGRVNSDGVAALRRRIRGNQGGGRPRRPAGRKRGPGRSEFSRWSLLEPVSPASDGVEAKARQLLRRYGVLFPELLAREPMTPRKRDLFQMLRRLEARGEIRGGRFVAGFVGEQFALPEAVEAMRAVKKVEPSGNFVVVSATDPLNLAGIVTPGDRVPAVLGNRLVFRDGVPMCSLENGVVLDRAVADGDTLSEARAMVRPDRLNGVRHHGERDRASRVTKVLR